MMSRVIIAVCGIIVLCFCSVVFNSDDFERVNPSVKIMIEKKKPQMSVEFSSNYYNPANTIKIIAQDSSGIRKYSVKITDSNDNILLNREEIMLKHKNIMQSTLPLLTQKLRDGDEITIAINVTDWSNANLFRGNETTIIKKVKIDTTAPAISIIASSYNINRGGSALVAFQANDNNENNIEKITLSNGKNSFNAYKYKNKNGKDIYLSLLSWPSDNTFFDGQIFAIDGALNAIELQIPIQKQLKITSRQINVRLKDESLQNALLRASDFVQMPDDADSSLKDSFLFMNDIKSKDNAVLMRKFKDFDISKDFPHFSSLSPLKDPSIAQYYNDEDIYFYKNDKIGNYKNVGMLMIANDPKVRTDGTIIYFDRMGSYGNVAVAYYALGLIAVYGHLDSLQNYKNKDVKNVIANIGNTGFSFRKILFFGILINGNFANPREWMNANWINENINSILDVANNY